MTKGNKIITAVSVGTALIYLSLVGAVSGESETIIETALPTGEYQTYICGEEIPCPEIIGSVESRIRYYADDDLEDLLIKISWCESRWQYFTGKIDKDDIGWYQINQRYNPIGIDCAMDLKCSTLWTQDQIRKGNLWKWNASRRCWSK